MWRLLQRGPYRLGGALVLLVAGMMAWHWYPLGSPFASGELVVLTRQSPTTYYVGVDGEPAGFEYDLVAEFARRQGLRLRLEVADELQDLVGDVAGGRAHLAAAGLSVTPDRAGRLRFGPVYASERELVLCGPHVRRPASLADLQAVRLEVVRASSHSERLQEVRQAYPTLRWREMDVASTEDLLERAATGLSDCTVADGGTYDVARHFWPDLVVAFDLTDQRDIAWAMPFNADMRLRQAVTDFFREIRRDGSLARLRERHFGHLGRLDEADVVGILARRTRTLPDLKAHFHHAQDEVGIDWRLLAALAYQESQWNALATSPTGVRGIMMLTSDTADRLRVVDRLDPRESILGGARYLAMLRDQLPARVEEPDRTWMALAAYNVGMGHLEDARRLTQKLGRDPNAWRDVKEVLPLLAKSSYAGKLRLGFARGGEARMLAENVRIYYDILKRFEAAHDGIDGSEALL
jgi:membrane-bound lytic murein transglycosylase F